MTRSGFSRRAAVARATLRNKRRRDRKRFDSLVATPHDLATPLALPAGCRLAFSHTQALSAGAVSLAVGSHTYVNKALAAGQVQRIDRAERGVTVTASDVSAPAGTLSLYIVGEFGEHVAIATLVTT